MKVQAINNVNKKINYEPVRSYQPVRTYEPVRSKNLNKAVNDKLDYKA